VAHAAEDLAVEDHGLGDRMDRLERLLHECDAAADPAWKAKLRQIVETLLEFHGAGLTRIVACLEDAGAPGRRVLETALQDDAARSLLLLYDLHPQTFRQRVEAGLEQVRPLLASHGGNVELLECSDEGAVRLRLTGSCHGCPSSQLTLKHAIEESLFAAAPEIARLDVEGVAPAEPSPADFVPLASLSPAHSSASPEAIPSQPRSR
jgi:Fe-S cluster biogenesis protein NfuA